MPPLFRFDLDRTLIPSNVTIYSGGDFDRRGGLPRDLAGQPAVAEVAENSRRRRIHNSQFSLTEQGYIIQGSCISRRVDFIGAYMCHPPLTKKLQEFRAKQSALIPIVHSARWALLATLPVGTVVCTHGVTLSCCGSGRRCTPSEPDGWQSLHFVHAAHPNILWLNTDDGQHN